VKQVMLHLWNYEHALVQSTTSLHALANNQWPVHQESGTTGRHEILNGMTPPVPEKKSL
jgi:hypothetical protein